MLSFTPRIGWYSKLQWRDIFNKKERVSVSVYIIETLDLSRILNVFFGYLGLYTRGGFNKNYISRIWTDRLAKENFH